MVEKIKNQHLRYFHRLNKKPGTAPGTIIAPHENEGEATKIRLFQYDKGFVQDKKNITASAVSVPKGTSRLWLDVVGLRNIKEIETIGETFHLHPLLLEDITHTDQRPKFDAYDGVLYIAARMFLLNEAREIRSEQVSIIIGKNFLISFQEKTGDVFDPVRERLLMNKKTIHSNGPAYLAYSLLDTIVDNYFLILEDIGERIETLEDELIKDPTPKTLHAINKQKQEALVLRRSVWPLRDVVNRFEREDSTLLNKETKVYIRDLYDHTVQIIEAIETYRDVLSGMVDLYLSSVSNKMNAIMKVLTIIATIFIPLTFIAGVYGMNFKHMPELDWQYGYPLVLFFMALVVGGMLSYFKKKGWFE